MVIEKDVIEQLEKSEKDIKEGKVKPAREFLKELHEIESERKL